MSVIFLLILVSLFVAGGFLIAFLWAVKSGQYEDDYSPAVRILFDENQETEAPRSPTEPAPQQNTQIISKGTEKLEPGSQTIH